MGSGRAHGPGQKSAGVIYSRPREALSVSVHSARTGSWTSMTPPAAGRGREARATPRADAEPGPDPTDLAARLHDWHRMIRRRLATRRALAHVLLATHATLDPQRVAVFLVSWAPGWWPLSIWAVVTSDVDGQLSVLSEQGVTDDVATSVQAVAGWVMHSGQAFASGDLRRDHRLPGPL